MGPCVCAHFLLHTAPKSESPFFISNQIEQRPPAGTARSFSPSGRSHRTSDGGVQPCSERGRYCAAGARPAGWRRRLLLSLPAFAAAALSGSARELRFDKHLYQGAVGGSRRVNTRGRESRRRANNFGRARPEVFLQKNKLVKCESVT